MSAKPAIPEPAATVILVRERAQGFEVFLTRRQESMKFLGGHYVFPGGKVDAADRTEEIPVRGADSVLLKRALASEESPLDCRAYWIAAARELYEETGVLLAVDEDERMVNAATLGDTRERLCDNEIGIGDVLREHGLRLALDRLHYLNHWITPDWIPMRYDTRFFLARLPVGAAATHDPREASEGAWMRPQEVLDAAEKNELPIVLPTIVSLRDIARFRHIDHLMAEYPPVFVP